MRQPKFSDGKIDPKRTPTRRLLLWGMVVAAAMLPPIVYGCAWDRDTMAAEVDGRMETLNALVGNFDVFPARYYEMRIERITEELKSNPKQLDLYDDIAVASDRVGRSTDAIEWMARKREQLDLLEDRDIEHEYRYLANLGTFYSHRWVGNGANREDLTDLKMGRELIMSAIILNPDAHFGREKYQLYAIEWLIDPPYYAPTNEFSDDIYPPILLPKSIIKYAPFYVRDPDDIRGNSLRRVGGADLQKIGLGDAIQGYTGLVTLGAAAESVDVCNSLARLLDLEGSSSLARIAGYRLDELVSNGRKSLHPNWSAPREAKIERFFPHGMTYSGSVKELAAWYVEARKRADASRAARNAFLAEMFARGEHPDTHPKVWSNAPRFAPLPKIPNTPSRYAESMRRERFSEAEIFLYQASFISALVFVALALLPVFAGRHKKSRAKSVAGAELAGEKGVPTTPQA